MQSLGSGSIEEIYKATNYKFARFTNPSLNQEIAFYLKTLDLNPALIDTYTLFKNVSTRKQAIQKVIAFCIKNNKICFVAPWYKILKDKINEFSYRYGRGCLIYKNSIPTFRKLFSLYIHLVCDNILSEMEFYELDLKLAYYISSQYATRYHYTKGFLTKIDLNIFVYPTCADPINIKTHHYLASFIEPPIPIPSLSSCSSLIYSIAHLADSECEYYHNILLPIRSMHLPKLANKNTSFLSKYLTNIEITMGREKGLRRMYYYHLLAIEHQRVLHQLTKLLNKKSGN